jgi:hypothetical protein
MWGLEPTSVPRALIKQVKTETNLDDYDQECCCYFCVWYFNSYLVLMRESMNLVMKYINQMASVSSCFWAHTAVLYLVAWTLLALCCLLCLCTTKTFGQPAGSPPTSAQLSQFTERELILHAD